MIPTDEPEGKKQYDREFLICLQRDPLSLQKPCNLPSMEIVKDKPYLAKREEEWLQADLTSPLGSSSRPSEDLHLQDRGSGGGITATSGASRSQV